jgi:ABC-type dipeptide/oligopeptide/nickel transport system permease component
VQLNFGAGSSDPEQLARLLGGALVLGFADGAFSGAVSGVRGLFESENRQRYVSIAILRGETPLSNTLPNVAAALAGQLRARTLHLLSGTVVVEVVLRINGLGDLLWGGALRQDFAVVLPVATGFALLSAFLLLVQALVEILASVHIRRSPSLSVVAP